MTTGKHSLMARIRGEKIVVEASMCYKNEMIRLFGEYARY